MTHQHLADLRAAYDAVIVELVAMQVRGVTTSEELGIRRGHLRIVAGGIAASEYATAPEHILAILKALGITP